MEACYFSQEEYCAFLCIHYDWIIYIKDEQTGGIYYGKRSSAAFERRGVPRIPGGEKRSAGGFLGILVRTLPHGGSHD